MKPCLLILVAFTTLMVAAAEPPTAKTGLSKNELLKNFVDKEWVAGQNSGGHFFFRRDGKLNGTMIGKRKFYTVEAPDILKIYEKDPAKDRKAEFEMFRVNVAALVAVPDVKASTKTGNGGPPLTYVGPAPKK